LNGANFLICKESENEKTENPDRLPVGKFFAWKSRDISIAAVTIVTGFVTMFCTDFLGMPAALVGTLLFAGRIFDGFTDLSDFLQTLINL
jgi:Na+/melibiose symporter-like transporter